MPHSTDIARKEYFRQWRARRGEAVLRREQKIKEDRATPEGKALRKEQAKRYYDKHRDIILAKGRERHKVKPQRQVLTWAQKNRLHIKKFGIDLETRAQMLLEQGGRCKICRADKPGTKHGWHLDHCHKTNKIRGVLCLRCNVLLGRANDDVVYLKALIDYLGAT